MAATDEKQVYNFDENFERATRDVLTAAGYADSFVQGGRDDLPESRIEIVFASGEALNEAALGDGSHVYDFYNGRLSVRIVTFRPVDQPSLLPGVSSLHSEWAAGVRAALQERREPFTQANLPYYAVRTIRPLSTQRDFDPRWIEDYTRLEFLVEWGIRSDAWPVAA